MTVQNRFFLLVCIVLNVFLLQNVAVATPSANDSLANRAKTLFEILSREPALEITITTNMTQLIEHRRTEEYLPATFAYDNEQGTTVTRNIEVQTRGKFRRRVCDFPPVRLKFAKKDLESEGLVKSYNKLKLVTHCLDDKEAGNENLLKEYLIYQLYNQLTPNSFRVQLAKVTYVDSEGLAAKVKRYGILIEDTDEMAARLHSREIETMNLSNDSISAQDEATMAMFQYMIANADWTTEMLRNVKMILPAGSAKAIPVPYDFDFSGLVNASYAIPQADKGLLTIRDRTYLGEFQDPALLRQTLRHFIQNKAALLKIVKSFKLLSVETRQDVTAYLESFYNAVEPAYADQSTDLVGFLKMRNATLETWKQAQVAARGVGNANK
jgi:hypothetical protein